MISIGAAQWLRMLLVISVIVPGMLFAFGAAEDYRLEFASAEDRARHTVGMLHEHAANVFRTHEIILKEIDDRVAGLSWDEIAASAPIQAWLARLARDIDVAQSVWLIDGEGHHRSHSQAFPAAPLDVSSRDYFQALKAKDVGTYIGAPILGKATGTVAFTVTRRRATADGHFDGVLSVAIAPSYFTDFYARIMPEPQRAVALVRSDGTLLARDPPYEGPQYAFRPESALMRSIGEGEEGVFEAPGEMDGVERIYAWKKLEGFPAVMLFGVPRAAVLARWHRWLMVSGAVAGVSAAGLFCLTLLALRRARAEETATRRLHEEMARREVAEAERRAAESQLRQSQKMEAIGQLTGGIAHDFNNLLTVVLGNLDLVVPGMGQGSAAAKRLVAAQEAAERATRLTKQLLAFARRQTLKPETIDLAASLDSMTQLLQSSLQSRVRVKTLLPEGLWPVRADREQLDLAILNIAVNARDAMPDGGTLEISAENVTLVAPTAAEEEAETGAPAGDYVALRLRDSGDGIEPDLLKRVFEPFFTTKEVGRGTGLGLSQVWGFARQSGGKATIESFVGDGTTVTLYLPRAVAEAAESEPAERAASPSLSGSILLVEDEAPIAELVRAILGERGFDVRHVPDADAALQRLAEGGLPDLVLSDIIMPGRLTGIDLADRLRARHPRLPVLLMTGYSDAVKDAVAAKFPILYKPFRAQDLVAAVQRSLEGAELRTERLTRVG